MIRLFRVFIPTSIIGLVITEVLLVFGCYLVGMAWQIEGLRFYLQFENGLIQLSVVTATIITGLYLNDCYERVRIHSKIIFLQQLCLVIGTTFLLQALLAYAKLDARMPRQAMLIGSVLCLFAMPLWRTVYHKLMLQILGSEKILFLGTHPMQFRLASYLTEHPEYAMKPIGFVVENPAAAESVETHPVLGVLADVFEVAARLSADRVMVGLKDNYYTAALPEILRLQQSRCRTDSMNESFETIFGRVAISQLQPLQILFKDGLTPSPVILAAQMLYSQLIALVALILLSPVMLVTAIAVRLTSKGPILFRQTRAGQHNVPFRLYKFRSMHVDAEVGTGAVWAQENDPRVTPLGRILRKYRLDELPQLFNVLQGQMVMVGPRPERPEFVKMLAEKIPFYKQRLCVKPGITGWAQINYRYGNTVEDTMVKLEYDLYYIKNLSPQLDFYIMFHTAKTMLLTRGAY